ncbi:MAG: alanine racemase [Bacteroidota bacterium]|nr:alanine racemase [Bacteroidota bacterium]
MTGRGWAVDTWRAWCQSEASSQGGAASLHGPADGMVRHLNADTRTLRQPKESVFFALAGPWHDGHAYLQAAHDAGVRRFVVSQPQSEGAPDSSDVLVVPDVLKAMQSMARTQRNAFTGPVLGVTGSNGKTTVKEWTASLLPERIAVHRSPLSHNSQLGVPLSVWALDAHHDIALIEAGLSHPSDMARLEACVAPTEGVLTHLGEAHLGNFQDAHHLAKEKCTLFQDCTRVFMPAFLKGACEPHLRCPVVTWALKGDSEETNAALVVDMAQGPAHVKLIWEGHAAAASLPFHDTASLRNAFTAALVALHHGGELQPVARGLERLQTLSGRLSHTNRPRGGVLITDNCNHDFGSLEVALGALARSVGSNRRVAIVGDIAQSGLTEIQRAHRMGALVGSLDVTDVWVWAPTWSDASAEAMVSALHAQPRGPDVTMVHVRETGQLTSLARDLNDANVLLKTSSDHPMGPVIQALAPARHVTTLTMNSSALVDNVRMLKAHVGAHGVIAVVKGLGYGTDPVVLGRLLEAQGVDWLAVAYADEGVALREAGIQARILVLNPDPATFDTIHALQLEPQLVSTTHVQMAQEWAHAHGVTDWPVHLKLDTGMHRLGLALEDDRHVANLLDGPELTLASVMTHLAGADDPGLDGATLLQIQSFMGRVQAHFQGVPCHVLNSAGATRLHEMLTADQRHDLSPVLSHLRVGLAMYGLGVGSEALGLQPVLSLHTSVAKLVHVPAGEGSGYGLTDAADHDRMLAVLSVGYADGYPRNLGNGRGQVFWKDQLLPTVGRVCMDMTTVDVTGLDVHAGDRVTLWGANPRLDDVAAQAKTISYELLTRLGPRVQRVIER